MKKLLHTLLFSWLPFAAHFDFFKKLAGLLAAASTAVKTAVAPLMPGFNARLEDEDAVMQWIRKSALTEEIAAADADIDRLLVGINAIVQTGLHSSMSAILESARRVHIMLKNYGNVAKESYNEEAGDVQALLEQFTGPFTQDVANLGMAMWVQQLQTALNTFNSLIRQRETEQGEKPPCTAREVRKAIEEAYYQIMTIVEANAITSESADFMAFIDLLNPEIDHLNAEFRRAKKDLGEGDHTVIEPLPVQNYTGRPVTPVPVVHYREEGKETVKLYMGKDFSVTYKNNIKIGMAKLTVHGKGPYKGQKSATFHIAQQPFPATEVESGELKVEN